MHFPPEKLAVVKNFVLVKVDSIRESERKVVHKKQV